MSDVHPDLRLIARFAPRGLAGPTLSPMMRSLGRLVRSKPIEGVSVSDLVARGTHLRVYRPAHSEPAGPALLWMHGGGMVIGRAVDDDLVVGAIVRELGILVVSVDYRLAPAHPFPAALDDCYAGLGWLHQQPGVDRERVAVGGNSAGGGLAASLAQIAHDRDELMVSFQLLAYPMLDDRSATRPGVDGRGFRLWNQKSNAYAWRCYLDREPGSDAVTAPAAPARRTDLAGLPPAWIGVGDNDLFHAEDLDYARRLAEAGVSCETLVVPGAFHGFDYAASKTGVAKDFRSAQRAALRTALRL